MYTAKRISWWNCYAWREIHWNPQILQIYPNCLISRVRTGPTDQATQTFITIGPNYLTRCGLKNACSGCSLVSAFKASSSSCVMTSRAGLCSSEQTGFFISWSKIKYLLSIWQSLASKLVYCRKQHVLLKIFRNVLCTTLLKSGSILFY